MLSLKDLRSILQFQRLSSIVGPFPLNVDVKKWELNSKVHRRKLLLSILSFLSFALVTGYKGGRLVHALLCYPDDPLFLTALHIDIFVGFSYIVVAYIMLFVKYPDVNASVMQMSIRTCRDVALQHQRLRRRPFSNYTLQDLMAAVMPYFSYPTILFVAAACAYAPHMRHTVYSGLPEEWQGSTLCYLGSVLLEFRNLQYGVSVALPNWQTQIMAFDAVTRKLKQTLDFTAKRHRLSSNDFHVLIKHLRSLQLYIRYVNLVNRYLIFSWKMVCISVGTLSGYAAIAHFTEQRIFGVVYYAVFVDMVAIYALIYDKAFAVPEKLKEATQCVMGRLVTDMPRSKERRVYERQLRSIRREGIQVGSFHVMERTSTPIFIGFIVTNVVNMLVTFK